MQLEPRTRAALFAYAELNMLQQFMVMRDLGVPVLPWTFTTVTQLAACFRWLYQERKMDEFIITMIGPE